MPKLISRWNEGEISKAILNWRWDKASKPVIMLRLFNVCIYYRRRSGWIMNGNNWACRRHIFDWYRVHPNLSILPRKRFD